MSHCLPSEASGGGGQMAADRELAATPLDFVAPIIASGTLRATARDHTQIRHPTTTSRPEASKYN
jgi:hypothetical protein